MHPLLPFATCPSRPTLVLPSLIVSEYQNPSLLFCCCFFSSSSSSPPPSLTKTNNQFRQNLLKYNNQSKTILPFQATFCKNETHREMGSRYTQQRITREAKSQARKYPFPSSLDLKTHKTSTKPKSPKTLLKPYDPQTLNRNTTKVHTAAMHT